MFLCVLNSLLMYAQWTADQGWACRTEAEAHRGAKSEREREREQERERERKRETEKERERKRGNRKRFDVDQGPECYHAALHVSRHVLEGPTASPAATVSTQDSLPSAAARAARGAPTAARCASSYLGPSVPAPLKQGFRRERDLSLGREGFRVKPMESDL